MERVKQELAKAWASGGSAVFDIQQHSALRLAGLVLQVLVCTRALQVSEHELPLNGAWEQQHRELPGQTWEAGGEGKDTSSVLTLLCCCGEVPALFQMDASHHFFNIADPYLAAMGKLTSFFWRTPLIVHCLSNGWPGYGTPSFEGTRPTSFILCESALATRMVIIPGTLALPFQAVHFCMEVFKNLWERGANKLS